MNTMTSLLGGLAAVFVLYAMGGAIRGLPAILRALLAGLIPLLAYFALIVGRWPGLDVVAMHISVFLAAGLVLFAVTQFRRHSVGRMHWAPKLLIAFFLGLVVVNGSLLYIATKGLPDPLARWWLGSDGTAVYSGFSGVVAHGQAAAKAVSSELSQAQRESELGWQVEVAGLDGNGPVRSIQVRVKDRSGLPIDRLEAELRLQRPGAVETALTVPLAALDAGTYGGVLRLPASGRWLAELRLLRDREVQYQLS
ncbi:MAG TPA: FixH family protein, partial [Thiobacillus sp.]|nr:FixH family protein [Thiobacillus sp.]